jgi:hypothetical protein
MIDKQLLIMQRLRTHFDSAKAGMRDTMARLRESNKKLQQVALDLDAGEDSDGAQSSEGLNGGGEATIAEQGSSEEIDGSTGGNGSASDDEEDVFAV